MSFIEVISADETLVREALSGGTWLADAIELIERDMRALWNVEANLRILKAIDESRDWYLGKAGAALPNPMLSTLIRPAGDEDQKLAHRLLAYVRAARCGQKVDTRIFIMFKVTSEMVLTELARCLDLAALKEAKSRLAEIFAYINKAHRRGDDEEHYAKMLEEKVRGYIKTLEQVSEGFAAEERSLMGEPPERAFERKAEASLDELTRGMGTLVRRAKVAPASARVRAWVWEKWQYFANHPEAVRGNVERRRVSVSDVWATVKEEAMAKHGIKTYEDFARIRKSAARAKFRAAK